MQDTVKNFFKGLIINITKSIIHTKTCKHLIETIYNAVVNVHNYMINLYIGYDRLA